jgi:metallo-beta-lactamase family protein
MQLTFLGAAGTVTGSRLLVEHDGHRVLVDCGMFQGTRDLRRRNWQPFAVDPATIDAVVVTHAHLDHSGWLPRLVAEGFAGPIHSTEHTAALAALVLRDAAHLQEEDAEYAAAKGYSKHADPRPLYDTAEAEKAIAQFRTHAYHVDFEACPGVRVRFNFAGHILGSATVTLTAGDRTLVVSGDLGRPDHALLRAPDPLPAADAVVVESTYGERPRPHHGLERLADAVGACLRAGGSVLIPAFAVDRTELVIKALGELIDAGRIPRVPVWLDSPMAAAALTIYRDALDAGSDEMRPMGSHDPFGIDGLRVAHSVAESKTLNDPAVPCIIVSASGMATGGRVVHHLAGMAPNPKNLIVLAGFQVPGTRGFDLLNGATAIKAHGRYVPVRASVLGLDEFSCHADADQLMEWLATAPHPPANCFTVHGEPEATVALARRINDELRWCAVPAHDGEKVRI